MVQDEVCVVSESDSSKSGCPVPGIRLVSGDNILLLLVCIISKCFYLLENNIVHMTMRANL